MAEELTMPHDLGREKGVLSVLMKYPERIADPALVEELFFLPAHRTVFREVKAAGSDIDLTSLVGDLHKRGLLDSVGGPAAITDIYTYAPNKQHFDKHLAELEDCRQRRKTAEVARQLLQSASDRSNPTAWLEDLESLKSIAPGSTAQGDGFPLRGISEMDEGEPAFDFVEGLLTEGGASVVYGESNVGKSFFVLDLAAHVAMGRAWRYEERAVERGAVVYVALEGTQGLRRRIEAMTSAGILTPDAPLYIVTAPVSLLDPAHGTKLAATVRAAADRSELPCRLVVIDTMARAMAGGNENAGEDMTAAVASIDAVKQATGAHVVIVHHAGKDAAKGARGHSSLRAAVDTEIELFRPEGERITTARVTKQRDIEPCEPMPFSLRVIELGTDRRGKPVTSCVVKHEDEVMASQPKKAGRKAVYSADAMLEYLPAASVSEWAARAKDECGVSNGKFYELKAELQHRKAYRAEAGTGRLVRA